MAKVTKTINGVSYPPSSFLVVEDAQKPDTWHLPVKTPDGKPDPKHMGAAWAALHGGYRGNKYEGPNKAEAISKLTRLYASIGKKPPMSKALFYRSGDVLWFFGAYSNNYMDTQGDILTNEAHEEYVSWTKTNGIKPPITVFHQPRYQDAVHLINYLGYRYGKYTTEQYNANLEALYKPFAIAKAERVITLNGFTFVIGRVYDHKRDVVEKLMSQENAWGMSHGFIPVKTSGNIIEKYRTFEFTVVPGEYAANQITPLRFIRKESEMSGELKSLDEEDRQVLEELLDGSAQDLEDATQKAKEILGGVLESKAVEEPDDETEDEDEEDEVVEEEKVETKTVFDTEMISQLTTTFKAIEGVLDEVRKDITELKAQYAEFGTALKTVQKSEDEKIAEKLVMPNFAEFFQHKSVEDEPVDDAKRVEKLKESIPDHIVEDKSKPSDNPLDGLFWGAFQQR
jgi:hypothetical protein